MKKKKLEFEKHKKGAETEKSLIKNEKIKNNNLQPAAFTQDPVKCQAALALK